MSEVPEGFEALWQAVSTLRAQHRNCEVPLGGCGLGGCPWPIVWEEDTQHLHQALTELGYEIVRKP